MRLPLPCLFFLALICLLVTAPCGALTYVPVADGDLAEQAEVIVRATIEGVETVERSAGIYTEYTVRPTSFVKGNIPGARFAVRVLGGVTAEGRGLAVWGTPRFVPGERVLLFLREGAEATYRVLHVQQGAFRETGPATAPLLVRSLAGSQALSPLDGAPIDMTPQVRDATLFEVWLRDRAAGLRRPVDYIVDAPAGLQPYFTYLSNDNPIRWFEFDTGGSISWLRHMEGQAGSDDRGRSAFGRALAAWNDERNTPLRLLDVGTTAATSAFSIADGENVILFRDFNNELSTDFSCNGGGALALGGVTFVSGSGPRLWRGRPFRVAVEAGIVMNDGISCFIRNNPRALEEVYTHELGHTLGLGHSCGDENSPPCTTPRFDEALMRASLHNDGRGAQLARDDRDGIRDLYDPDSSTSCPREPGHGRFCTECGPCDTGEGGCRTDADCRGDLVCTPDRGADFGFRPRIDVCLPPTGGGGGGGDDCTLPPGHPRYCKECGPCGAGEGGCKRDSQCRNGLVCAVDRGADFGLDANVDVCVAGGGSCTAELGSNPFCTRCGPCAFGQGDCDSDAECASGLSCVEKAGPQFGYRPNIDVCM